MRRSVQAVAPVSERGNRARGGKRLGLRQESQRPPWRARPLAGGRSRPQDRPVLALGEAKADRKR